jgi:hypothetical protein
MDLMAKSILERRPDFGGVNQLSPELMTRGNRVVRHGGVNSHHAARRCTDEEYEKGQQAGDVKWRAQPSTVAHLPWRVTPSRVISASTSE